MLKVWGPATEYWVGGSYNFDVGGYTSFTDTTSEFFILKSSGQLIINFTFLYIIRICVHITGDTGPIISRWNDDKFKYYNKPAGQDGRTFICAKGKYYSTNENHVPINHKPISTYLLLPIICQTIITAFMI